MEHPDIPLASETDVTDQLRERILHGGFTPNSPLRIDALATQFGVSHMPIREALRRLETEGLVTMSRNRGARAVEVTPKFVGAIFDLRTVVEAYMTRRAAERMADRDLALLHEIQARHEAAAQVEDVVGALQANREFHSAIYAIADNHDGVLILDRHWRLIMALWRAYGYSRTRFAAVIADHRQMLAAFAERDVEGAAALSAAHSTRAKQNLLRRMREALQTQDLRAPQRGRSGIEAGDGFAPDEAANEGHA